MKTVSVASLAVGLALAPGFARAADLPATTMPAMSAPPPFFFFSDTVLEYRVETQATDPGSPAKFLKNIANITHVDAFQYGTNFISVDVLQSQTQDPVSPTAQQFYGGPTPAGYGSRELYSLYRGTISGNAVTHSKAFAFGGIVKDVSFEYGGDLEVQNTQFAPEKTDIVFGPNIAFDVPGLLNVGIHVYQEWNHNSIAGPILGLPSNKNYDAATGAVTFDPTAEFEFVYLFPLTFTHMPLTFSGFANVVLPKGIDGFGHETRTEFLTTQRLTLDVGSYFSHPKLIDAFVGYKFWYDKFGNNAQYGPNSYTSGSYENQFIAGFDYHLQ